MTLPPETIHLPFEDGPHRMAMGLTTAPEAEWFEFDDLYPTEMGLRRALLTERRAEVFASLPVSDAARRETLDAMAASLAARRPDLFALSGARLDNRATGEIWDARDPGIDPLDCAARLVQEDLCLIQLDDGVPVLTAAALCFPSRWRLAEKIGLPLAEIHAPVPIYPERLERPVDRFMRHLKPGHIATRRNWSILDDPALFQPTGKWRDLPSDGIDAANAGGKLFLRVERQSLRRLPVSDAVLFGIRVHVYPLSRAIDAPDKARRLAAAVRALPDAILHYKSMRPIKGALLGWLDAGAGA